MRSHPARSSRGTRSVLHAVFALTAVVHAIGGPLLPSLNHTFHLTDSESGLLFLAYFGGSSIGALLCRGNYAHVMTVGFAGMSIFSLAVSMVTHPLLLPVYFLLGICVGAAMSAVSLFAGRNFPDTSASLLTLLNFSWSAGALAAPMLAAQFLRHHTYRAAYIGIAVASSVAALTCSRLLSDAAESPEVPTASTRLGDLKFVLVFALMAFLQVGVENTASVWLTTYVLRIGNTNMVRSAASSSLFWFGFLASRAISAAVLLRIRPDLLLRTSLAVALGAALLLIGSSQLLVTSLAMILLGVALAPIYPLLVAAAMIRLRHTSDARYVLATAGFGGSILPWAAGWISTLTKEIRVGIAMIPVAILSMMLCFRSIRQFSREQAQH